MHRLGTDRWLESNDRMFLNRKCLLVRVSSRSSWRSHCWDRSPAFVNRNEYFWIDLCGFEAFSFGRFNWFIRHWIIYFFTMDWLRRLAKNNVQFWFDVLIYISSTFWSKIWTMWLLQHLQWTEACRFSSHRKKNAKNQNRSDGNSIRSANTHVDDEPQSQKKTQQEIKIEKIPSIRIASHYLQSLRLTFRLFCLMFPEINEWK